MDQYGQFPEEDLFNPTCRKCGSPLRQLDDEVPTEFEAIEDGYVAICTKCRTLSAGE